MSTRRIYLHVGAPKTGTTYLQDRLSLNRTSLDRHGIHYPLGLRASHFKPALDLIDRPWEGVRQRTRGEWDALVRRARRLDGTVLISHEILASAEPAQVDRAMAGFEGDDVHVVYSARDLARQIPAAWQEGVKHRSGASFQKFLDQLRATQRDGSDLWFWRVQNLRDVLERWSAGIPAHNVHLVTVPQPGAPPDQLWHRFCEVFGIEPAWAPRDSDRANQSIGAAETDLLRRLNRRLGGRAVLAADDYRELVRETLAHDTLAHREAMTRTTLPPHAYPWATGLAEEWVGWVEASGFDVVGDLDDLRPAPAPAEQEWADPDQPPREDVLDAALDALVAMVVEASRRPNPTRRVTAQATKAVRRLRRR